MDENNFLSVLEQYQGKETYSRKISPKILEIAKAVRENPEIEIHYEQVKFPSFPTYFLDKPNWPFTSHDLSLMFNGREEWMREFLISENKKLMIDDLLSQIDDPETISAFTKLREMYNQ